MRTKKVAIWGILRETKPDKAKKAEKIGKYSEMKRLWKEV